VTSGHPRRPDALAVSLLRQLLVSWLVNAVVLAIVDWTFTTVHVSTTGQLLLAAAVFGALNTFLKPILRLLTLPLAVVTLGIAWFGVAMLMLWLTTLIVPGFKIDGFWAYVWATVAIWAVNVVLELVFYVLGVPRRRRARAARRAQHA
jgi:putative membrane protein